MPTTHTLSRAIAVLSSALVALGAGSVRATTLLADQPLFAGNDAPGNLALVLSVEFPTAVSVAHLDRNYTSAQTYLGFFDTNKCYSYASSGGSTTPSLLVNGSFETPPQGSGGYSYGTGGGTWNFVGGAGLTGNPSAFTSGNPNTSDGLQVAFLQVDGSMTQSVTLSAGTYTLTYRAAQRGNYQYGTQVVRASLDGTPLGTFQPVGTAYEASPTYTFTVTAGSHTFELAGVGGGGGDYTAFVDSVVLASASAAPPAPQVDWFVPVGLANARQCSGQWSGNFLNWATMQVIDPFRWVLTGGYRVVDTPTTTVIEKAWGTYQGGYGNFPNSVLPSSQVAGATPFGAIGSPVYMRVWGLGNKMRFALPYSNDWNSYPALDNDSLVSPYDPQAGGSPGRVYDVFVRAQVCDGSSDSGGLEANCVAYGQNFKPEGLIQKYANRIRYSAFAYLNDDNIYRDGGVLRARQKFVGPNRPMPGSPPIVNTAREWNPTTGVFVRNPNPTDATDTNALFGTSVQDSGVMNYLNKFGEITPGSYKTYDNVSELYYAAIRYFKNQGNVPEWSEMGGVGQGTRNRYVDGFPVITQWDDPILYACQKNFILGIGDVNTHADKNVPGNTTMTANEPAMPAAVASDNTTNAVTATDKIGILEGWGPGLGSVQNFGGCCSNNSGLIAGLAYDAHTRDIRPNDFRTAGVAREPITIDTYWVDILEYLQYKPNNQFYLAAKYGGFKKPTNYDFANNTTPLTTDWWTNNPDNLSGQRRPDNYFIGGRPDLAAAGLTSAFADIASKIKSFTTSFSAALPQVATSGTASFSSTYDAGEWKGELKASDLQFDAGGNPALVEKWRFSERLATQTGGSGWSSNRRIATWNTLTERGVPFRIGDLAPTQSMALDTLYGTGNDRSDFLDYLRGDQKHEVNSNASGSRREYRARTALVGDIVGSKAVPIGPPAFAYAEALNPGYAAFKTTWAARPLVVYVGANDGMMHAVDGHLTSASGGSEMFAYVPAALYGGPGSTPGVDGLASIGNPDFTHHYFVNVSPNVYDLDMARTPDATGAPQSGTPDWRSVLIGGLGKGGRSYYAIDVTDPVSMASGGETAVASKILWEFTDPELGFTFGEPIVVKTKKYGWVVVIASGYNNDTGRGFFFLLNPRTGALLEKVTTGVGTVSNDAGMAHANAFVVNSADGTADSVYAGDLLGNLWRLDLTVPAGTAIPAPTKIGRLVDGNGAAQPVTSRPVIEVHPYTKRRFVMVGTGRLLSTADVSSGQNQSFYAISDGSNALFNRASDLPSGILFPIDRSRLHANAQPVANAVAFDPTTQMGWYEDLGTAAGGIGYRVTMDSTTLLGSVAFGATLPNGSVCSPSGTTNVYARDYAVGSTTLKDLVDGVLAPVSFVTQAGTVTDLRYLSVAGRGRLIVGTDTGQVNKIEIMPPPSMSLRRLNWRELPVVE